MITNISFHSSTLETLGKILPLTMFTEAGLFQSLFAEETRQSERGDRYRMAIYDLCIYSYSLIHLLMYNLQEIECAILSCSVMWLLTTVDIYETHILRENLNH